MNVRSFIKYWLPVLLWMVFIFIGSTDLMSAEHTSRFIGPFLRWFVPDIAPATIISIQLFVRKCAHLTVYAILAALLYRAFLQSIGRLGSAGVFAFVVAVAYASLDEFHQSFVVSRSGSPIDVAIDAAGALIGLMLYWFMIRRRPIEI